ncbi:MAG: hypothetical protein ACSLFP_09200 [Acidimicrobiales bacterium]
MCMGCASNADFIVTSGILGGASLRVAARRFLPVTPQWARKVTDEEANAFVAEVSAEPLVDRVAEPTAEPLAVPASGPAARPAPEPVLADR